MVLNKWTIVFLAVVSSLNPSAPPLEKHENKLIQEVKEKEVVVEEIEEVVEEVFEVIKEQPKLVDAMIQVESRGIEDAVGDSHLGAPSIGVLQIRPIMVKEINRILKEEVYTLEDRFSREKSIEMFEIWKNHYHKNSSDEVIARCWNGGPNGWKREATEYYWKKVTKARAEISR